MQRHPLQHCFAGYSDPGWSLLSADLVETSGLRACWVCSDDCEERHSDRYANDAGNLCGSGISLWQSSPRRRSGIFMIGLLLMVPVFWILQTRESAANLQAPKISAPVVES